MDENVCLLKQLRLGFDQLLEAIGPTSPGVVFTLFFQKLGLDIMCFENDRRELMKKPPTQSQGKSQRINVVNMK